MDLPSVEGIALHFCDEKDTQGRVAAMKLGSLMVTKEHSDFGFFIGKDMINWAVKSRMTDYRRGAPLDADLINRCKIQLAATPNASTIIDKAAAAYSSGQSYARLFRGLPSPYTHIENCTPGLSAWSLLALLMLPLGIAVLRLKPQEPHASHWVFGSE